MVSVCYAWLHTKMGSSGELILRSRKYRCKIILVRDFLNFWGTKGRVESGSLFAVRSEKVALKQA